MLPRGHASIEAQEIPSCTDRALQLMKKRPPRMTKNTKSYVDKIIPQTPSMVKRVLVASPSSTTQAKYPNNGSCRARSFLLNLRHARELSHAAPNIANNIKQRGTQN